MKKKLVAGLLAGVFAVSGSVIAFGQDCFGNVDYEGISGFGNMLQPGDPMNPGEGSGDIPIHNWPPPGSQRP